MPVFTSYNALTGYKLIRPSIQYSKNIPQYKNIRYFEDFFCCTLSAVNAQNHVCLLPLIGMGVIC